MIAAMSARKSDSQEISRVDSSLVSHIPYYVAISVSDTISKEQVTLY